MTDAEFPAVILKSRAEQIVEAAHGGRDLKEILRGLYHDQKLNQQQIARKLGVARSTVVEWMQRYEIPTGYNKADDAPEAVA